MGVQPLQDGEDIVDDEDYDRDEVVEILSSKFHSRARIAMEESGDEYNQECQDMEELQHDVVTSQPKPKKKGRGPSKGVQTTTPIFLEFDEFGLPTGKWESEYGKQIETCSKKVDINVKEYSKMDKEEKKKPMGGDKGVKEKNFHVAVGNRFRGHKSWLNARFITKTEAPTEDSPSAKMKPWELYKGFISELQWKDFEAYYTSKEFKLKSERGKENAKQNKYRHHLGQRSYGRAREHWKKSNRLPPVSESSTTSNTTELSTTTSLNERLTHRSLEWVLARQIKLPDGSWGIDPKDVDTVAIAKSVLENMKTKSVERQEGTSSCEERGIDALTLALGKKDNRGHVKGLGRCGVGVGLTQAFGKKDRKGKRSSHNSCSFSELEAMKDSLTQEFEAKFEERLSQRVVEEIQTYVANLIPRSNSTLPIMPAITELQSPLANNLNQIKATRVIQVPTPCFLTLIDEYNENKVVVADGTAQPCLDGVTHNLTMNPKHYRVSVDYPYPDYASLDLPVKAPDGETKLGKATGYFVEWPIYLVIFKDEDMGPLIKKAKSVEANEKVDSCGVKSRQSTTKGFALLDDSIVGSLSECCEMLYWCMSSDIDKYDTITVSLKAPYFYQNEDKKTFVTATDVSELLRGAWANVSLFHVYILYLIHMHISILNITEITFLCPQRISVAEIEHDYLEVHGYVKKAFMSELEKEDKHCKFMLAPYLQSNHWVLLVINLQLGLVFEFDPATCPKKTPRKLRLADILMKAYKVYLSKLKGNVLKSRRKNLLFKQMEVHK
uniref:DUF8039 domain-containing protein n=1 Tax=Chenopodium quinoa TaxID=63459 RepID=A0A803N632_CHEQI